jgi:hypothetical protein
MPRGSKPGERRGGRQRGTPNKKTVLRNAAVCAAALDPHISPRDFMLGLVRNSDLPLAERFAAAQAVLPLVHPKLTSGHRTQSSLDGQRAAVNALQPTDPRSAVAGRDAHNRRADTPAPRRTASGFTAATSCAMTPTYVVSLHR